VHMDAGRRAQFKEKGYFVVEDAVSPEHLAALNDEYTRRVAAEVPPTAVDGGPLLWAGFPKPEWPRRLWSQAYIDLVDLSTVAPLLAELFSDPQYEHTGSSSSSTRGSQRYRLDHDNIHFSPGFDPDMNLEYEGRLPKEYWSPDGIVRGGIHGGAPGREGVPMITCVYELLPVPVGCGGTTVCSNTMR
jgi:hypothetical protein